MNPDFNPSQYTVTAWPSYPPVEPTHQPHEIRYPFDQPHEVAVPLLPVPVPLPHVSHLVVKYPVEAPFQLLAGQTCHPVSAYVDIV
ncbi:hypothetical protein V6N13_050162 [Hibiscus sabdariffa]|uniref:Uncharacterized protein n=2 Tax=Hibiscus sabdariffa TaxID=183260 RepID=A0ABR2QV93_9ROSI